MKIESQQNNVEFLRETAEWTHLVSKSITLENWIKTQQTSWFLVLGAYFISRFLQFLREITLCVQNKGMKFNCFMLISLVFSIFMLQRAQRCYSNQHEKKGEKRANETLINNLKYFFYASSSVNAEGEADESYEKWKKNCAKGMILHVSQLSCAARSEKKLHHLFAYENQFMCGSFAIRLKTQETRWQRRGME